MTVVPVSSGNTARHQLLLRDLAPAGICGTPSFVLHIAETLIAEGENPRTLGVRYGMFGHEPWTEGMRASLEKALGCPAYDIYGLSEIIGPGVAGECEVRDGLHIQDDHFLPEVIDPATDQVLGPGREGELVLTTLTKRALPLVRYRTGDVTTLTDAPCPCGRDRKSTRLNSSHSQISYAVFCLKKKKTKNKQAQESPKYHAQKQRK